MNSNEFIHLEHLITLILRDSRTKTNTSTSTRLRSSFIRLSVSRRSLAGFPRTRRSDTLLTPGGEVEEKEKEKKSFYHSSEFLFYAPPNPPPQTTISHQTFSHPLPLITM